MRNLRKVSKAKDGAGRYSGEPENAFIEAGGPIDVIEEQPRKAPSPMLVRLAGSAIDVNKEHS
jgi:hypothetical protein